MLPLHVSDHRLNCPVSDILEDNSYTPHIEALYCKCRKGSKIQVYPVHLFGRHAAARNHLLEIHIIKIMTLDMESMENKNAVATRWYFIIFYLLITPNHKNKINILNMPVSCYSLAKCIRCSCIYRHMMSKVMFMKPRVCIEN